MDNKPSNLSGDSEMADNNDEKVVTMMDVLQEQQDFEEDANAVLGASDDKNCTYPMGYVKRQALYSCLTCCNEPDKKAAVCLACSLNCHENHELIELYTKRNFRCDCGNPKFDNPCQLIPDKTALNDDNKYNQNFSGLYCTCHRPYPDPDGDDNGDMIQCIICEDWLHANHLEATVPPNGQYSEMICKDCMNDNLFLHDYTRYAIGAQENGYTEDEEVDESLNDTKTNGDGAEENGELDKPKENESEPSEQETCEKTEEVEEDKDPKVEEEIKETTEEKKDDTQKEEDSEKTASEQDKPEKANTDETSKRKLDDVDSGVSPKKSKLEEKCVKPRGGKIIFEGATFWPSDFRQKLCTCSKCLEMYKDLCVLYLTDPDDTVTAYETLGKEKLDGISQYEQGMQALSSLDRIQQINAMTEYNNMKDKLLDYLKNFKEKKVIVKEEDIKAFFAAMKPKREPDGVYFCR